MQNCVNQTFLARYVKYVDVGAVVILGCLLGKCSLEQLRFSREPLTDFFVPSGFVDRSQAHEEGEEILSFHFVLYFCSH